MTLSELHNRLKEEGVPEHRYYLNGRYGSTDDNDRLALTIRRGRFNVEYETYFNERGEKYSVRVFNNERDACEYLYERLTDEHIFYRIQKIDGLGGMTVNERLYASSLMDVFDTAMLHNKQRAKKILRWLQVDEPSIEQIVG